MGCFDQTETVLQLLRVLHSRLVARVRCKRLLLNSIWLLLLSDLLDAQLERLVHVLGLQDL
jgi:hypothetical protein